MALVIALLLNYVIRYSLLPTSALDSDGHVSDISMIKIMNGLCLCVVVHLVIFFDTRTHTYFFLIGVILIFTLIPTSGFFIAENYFGFL